MTVKFKVGFTIDGETVFALFAKLLPIEDLEVEELAPKLAQRSIAPERLVPPKPKKKKRATRLDLLNGINGIVLRQLADGEPHRAADLEPLLKAGGYSGNSIGSRLQTLRAHGIVEQLGNGTWRLVKRETPSQA